jgi:hypothetical protein
MLRILEVYPGSGFFTILNPRSNNKKGKKSIIYLTIFVSINFPKFKIIKFVEQVQKKI